MRYRYPRPYQIALFVLLASGFTAQAQSYEKSIPAPPFSIEPSIRSSQLQAGDGSSFLFANANIGTLGDANLLLLKLDNTGSPTHDIAIGDIGGQGYHDVGMEAVQLEADLYICGYTRAIDTAATPTFTAFLMHLDTALNFLAQTNYIIPAPFELYANAMTATAGGDLLIAGQIYDGSDFHTLLMKVATDGSLIWTKQFDITNGERVHCVRELGNGEILLSGNMIFGLELVLPFAMKLDSDGDVVWGNIYNYPPQQPVEHSNFLFIHQNSAEDIMLCGHTDVVGVGGEDYYIVDINSAGAVNWARTYGSFQWEFPSAAAYDAASDEVVLLGNTSSFTFSFNPVAMAARIQPTGQLTAAYLYGDTTGTLSSTLTATQRVDATTRMVSGWRSFPADDLYLSVTDNDLTTTCHGYPIFLTDVQQSSGIGNPVIVPVLPPTIILNDSMLTSGDFSSITTICNGPNGVINCPAYPASFSVYPDPAIDDVYVTIPKGLGIGDHLELLDAQGRVLRMIHGQGEGMVVISRDDLKPGMYVVRVMHADASWQSARLVLE